ncbi:MAG TPA: response regulator [Anaerolineae bacterium]|nr:response regulator [Anaerolineae bacterium]
MARILVIDDDGHALRLIEFALTKAGYEVITASRGEEGLQKAFRQPPDLAIIDLMMPQMDGYEVCRRLRQNERTADTPIMVFTARIQEIDRQTALEAGADEFLTKTATPDELVSKVKSLLAREVSVPRAEARPGQVIALFSLRGGVGVSSLAINLAMALARQPNQKVALLDLCFLSSSVPLMLNVRPKLSLAELSREETTVSLDSLEKYMVAHSSGVKVLPVVLSLVRAAPIPAKTVEHVLAVLKSGFNYIIVDTLSSLDDMTLAALIRSDQIILVVVPEVASIQAATVTLQAFRSLGISEEAIVPTVNHTFAKGGLSLGTIQSALKRPIKAVIPYEPEVLIQAINSGAPLVLSHPSSAMATAIQKLASVLSPS